MYSAKPRPNENSDIVRPSNHATDVGLGEIITLEEKWLTCRAGQRVGEHVAEIEAGGVTS